MKQYNVTYFRYIIIIVLAIYNSASYAQELVPVVYIDQTPISVLMDNPYIMSKYIYYGNKGGSADLQYEISIDYKRTADWSKSLDLSANHIPDSIPISRRFQYVDTLLLSASYGGVENHEFKVATRFNGGANGINVSDVGTWFFCENLKEGDIYVEILAGGNSIEEAFLISKGNLKYKSEDNSLNGKMYNIKLEKSASIYPNEDFYVVFTFPAGIRRPQGCVVNESVETVRGRYLMFEQQKWKDVQLNEGHSKYAWIMYASERVPKNNNWLTLSGWGSGKLRPGTESSIGLRINGSLANLGAQYADVVFKTNDPVNPIVRVPVTLRRNEAPHFENAPAEIFIVEDSTTVVAIDVIDYEEDAFKVEPIQGCKIASFIIEDSKLILTVAPKKGDAGNYIMKFKATDQHKVARELTIKINVSQPPVYIGPTPPLIFSFREDSVRHSIHNLFMDPDGDNISFTVSSRDESIITVSQQSDSIFFVKPVKVGETALAFVVRDDRGSRLVSEIDVIVGECINPETIVRQKWNSILFVDNSSGNFVADGYQWYRNNEPIPDQNKQYYSSEGDTGGELDYTAEYYVRLVTVNGETIYSCPIYPSKRSLSVLATPNPVQRGGALSIKVDLPDQVTDKGNVQIFNITGHLLKSIDVSGGNISVKVPSQEGLYLVKVVMGNMTKTFMVKVD